MATTAHEGAFYRMIWRWHFYAGLFVMPFIVVLSLSGALYLFKPQVERWEERAWQGLPTSDAVSANAQLDAALAAFPGARFDHYRLPERVGDAAMIHLGLSDGKSMRDVFVSPQGRVIGSINPESRIIAWDRRIHGQLLLGTRGSWIVELAASWAIVMIVTGLYLWWPRGRGMAGVLWPHRRTMVRDLHAVTGFWVSSLALVLLFTGLPWASVWGDAFKAFRSELGLVQGKQDWTTGGKGGGEHAEHDHSAMMRMQAAGVSMVGLGEIVAQARTEDLAFPVLVSLSLEKMVWTVKSDAQNRPLRATVTYDMATGKRLSRQDFADRHPIDKVIGYGIAWHEGQLFGWVNQLIGVLTAAALLTLMTTGFLMWRRRRPVDKLGAPPALSLPVRMRGVVAIMLAFAILLPMFAGSLMILFVAKRFVLRRSARLASWLGLAPPRA